MWPFSSSGSSYLLLAENPSSVLWTCIPTRWAPRSKCASIFCVYAREPQRLYDPKHSENRGLEINRPKKCRWQKPCIPQRQNATYSGLGGQHQILEHGWGWVKKRPLPWQIQPACTSIAGPITTSSECFPYMPANECRLKPCARTPPWNTTMEHHRGTPPRASYNEVIKELQCFQMGFLGNIINFI